MTANEQQLEALRAEHQRYTHELHQLERSVEEEKDYRMRQITVDDKLPAIRDKLTELYSEILFLQEQIALKLKSRRL